MHLRGHLDLSKPLCTRDGRKARIIDSNLVRIKGVMVRCLRAEVCHPNHPTEMAKWNYTLSGHWHFDGRTNRNDLVPEMPWHAWLRDADVSRLKDRSVS